MIKLSKVSVLVLVTLLPLMVSIATAGFAFSFPQGTIVTSPLGFGSGPTTFNTYFHDSTVLDTGAAADAAFNVGGATPFGLGCGLPFSFVPFGVGNAANTGWGSTAAEDQTLATSFTTAGGAAFPGLISTSFAGGDPNMPFVLNFF
jgi:hypothetical protein